MKTKIDKILYIIVLLTALFVLSQCQIKKQALPSDPYDSIFQITKADYCDNAPECYYGSKGLTFGNKLAEKIKYFPPYTYPLIILNLDKLAYAVSIHESNGCNSYVARMYNNCHGIRRNGTWQHYVSKEDSFNDFKEIWSKYYKKFPDYELADKYSGGDRTNEWLNNVTKIYNETI
uniref:Putative glycoside hydrolase n=2 Tax=viral metagenome TaxID=1070528 RepID=A0A6H2A0S5_9ZZZZ